MALCYRHFILKSFGRYSVIHSTPGLSLLSNLQYSLNDKKPIRTRVLYERKSDNPRSFLALSIFRVMDRLHGI